MATFDDLPVCGGDGHAPDLVRPADAVQADGHTDGAFLGTGVIELGAWIADLRGRVERGELDDVEPVAVDGAAKLGVLMAVRVMLADLDHFGDLTSGQQRDPLVMARRLYLLGTLSELRARIG